MSNTELTNAERASLRLFGSQMAQGIRTAVDASELATVGDDLVLSMIHEGVAYFEAFSLVAPFDRDTWASRLHYCDADAWTAFHAPADDDEVDLGSDYDWHLIQAERANEVALYGDWS